MPRTLRAPTPEALAGELGRAPLPDKRLNKRLRSMVESVAAMPDASFPSICAGESELEAAYRFLGNDRVTWQKLLAQHLDATVERCKAHGTVLAVHDSSYFYFQGDTLRHGLGHMPRGQGFLGHFALAVGTGEQRLPLGLLGFEPMVRDEPVRGRSKNQQRVDTARKDPDDRESARWRVMVERVEKLTGLDVPTIHVCDSEGDDYLLLAALTEGKRRFVIRGSENRNIVTEDGPSKLNTELARSGSIGFREVELSRRGWKNAANAKRHPPRKARMAKLSVRWAEVALRRPQNVKSGPKQLSVIVVQVHEPEPPAGEPGVEWTLLTSESVSSLEQAAFVVDTYRARWTIEEFFKALKTGCAYEKRQLESLHALLNALALLAPMAWRLLLLRTLSRSGTELPASRVFTADELQLLIAISKRVRLSENPTTSEVLLAIAGLGGHIKNNGPPGWIVIGRGYDKFTDAYIGWAAARAEM